MELSSDLPNAPWEVGLTPEFSVGSEEGDPAFQCLYAAATRSDGVIAAGDSCAGTIYLISATGALVDSLGRSGSGPGEFEDINSIVALGGDTIVVQDDVNRRLTLIAATTVLQTDRFVAATGAVGHQIVSRLGPGEYAMVPVSFSGRPTGSDSWVKAPVVRARVAPPALDTIALFDLYEDRSPLDTSPIRYFGLAAWSVEGFAAVRTDRPEVRWFDEFGVLRQVSRWQRDRDLVSADDWARYEAYVRSYRDAGPELEAHLLEVRRAFKGTRPVASHVAADPVGNLWMAEHTFQGSMASTFIIMSADGERLSIARFPKEIRLLEVRARAVLALTSDSLGVQSLVQYGIAGPQNSGPQN